MGKSQKNICPECHCEIGAFPLTFKDGSLGCEECVLEDNKKIKFSWYLDNYPSLDIDDCERLDEYGDITKLKNKWVTIIFGDFLSALWCAGFDNKQDVEDFLKDSIEEINSDSDIIVYHFGKVVNWKFSIED
jgi:hypothetical protein